MPTKKEEVMEPRAKVKLKLKPKPFAVNLESGEIGPSVIKNAEEVTQTRHQAEVLAREADLGMANGVIESRKSKADTTYRDETGKLVSPARLAEYQKIVGDYYRQFVILTDEQREELKSKLPKKLNNLTVQVGSKAVFPHILDQERKKVARGRIVTKMNRLKYIESDEQRGLKLAEEDAQEVFDRYKMQTQAKKDLVRTLISLSYNDFEICEYLQIKGHELARLKKEIFYEEITAHRNMTNEELFAQYRMQQMEVVKDIDVLVERFKNSQQLNALAAVLKAKADIIDRIIQKGQEFGVIVKAVDKQAVFVGHLNLADASSDQLESELMTTNKEIQRLLSSKSVLDP